MKFSVPGRRTQPQHSGPFILVSPTFSALLFVTCFLISSPFLNKCLYNILYSCVYPISLVGVEFLGEPFQNIPTTLPLITTPLLRDNQRLNQPRAPTSREKVREKEQTCRKSVLLLGLPFWSTAGTGWRDPSKCDSKCTFSKCESTSRSTTAAPAVLGPHFASCTGSWETCIAGSLPSPQLYLAPLPHLPTLQSSFKSSNTPCSFGPQGLCTTSINLHLVNPFCRFQLQDHFLFYEPLLTPNPLCDLMSLTILCNSQLPNRYLNIIW